MYSHGMERRWKRDAEDVPKMHSQMHYAINKCIYIMKKGRIIHLVLHRYKKKRILAA
jgi:hypothetical protein